MKSIREWLNGSRNYRLGEVLYQVHGHDAALKTMFAQGHSMHRQRRLEAELEALLKQMDHSAVAQSIAQQKQKQHAVQAPAGPSVAQPAAQSPATGKWQDDPYKEQWTPLFAQMNLLRHRLVQVETDEERGKMAFDIIQLEQQCDTYWRLRDHYQRTGIINQPNADITERPVVNINDLQRKLNNMRTYVARYKKLVAKNPDSLQYKQLLEDYTAQRDKIEEQLGYERAKAQ